jgi:hypothetical protein
MDDILIPVKYKTLAGSLKTTLMKCGEMVSSLEVPVIVDKSVLSMYFFREIDKTTYQLLQCIF